MIHCSPTADDSVEHYFCCPVWKEWQRRRLGARVAEHGLAHGMLATPMTDEDLRLQAVATYVLYRTVNHVRRLLTADETARKAFVHHYMDQQVHEATRDDSKLRSYCAEAGWAAWAKRPREGDAGHTVRRVRPRGGAASSAPAEETYQR